MSEEKTPGQVSWTARNMALAGPGDQPGDVLAELGHAWGYLNPEAREAEEVGAQAVLDNRASSAAATETGLRLALAFIEQVCDGGYGDRARVDAQQALDEISFDEVAQRAADLRAHAGGMGGPSPASVTDNAAGVAAEQEREARQHARDMAAEDGDLDDCEPAP
jgi:hypothetical protein